MSPASNVQSIIDRQVKFWEVRSRLAEVGGESARRALAHLDEGPWITISRQLGSGGVDLAHRLAERLGWQVFDKQILSSIAQQTQTRETILSRLDEKAVVAFNDFLAQVLFPGEPGQATFLHEMIEVIWGIARQGNAVILGRGAHCFLHSRFGLRLRVVAPDERRVEGLMRSESIGADEARERARRYDSEQAAFLRQAFDRGLDDALQFDLVLNLGALDVESAADAALAALHGKLAMVPPGAQRAD